MPFINRPSNAIVTAEEMQAIESRLFDAGMPVAALMEKVGLLLAAKIQTHYPRHLYPRISVLIGPGHNGGDAWVVARELWQAGYDIKIFQPFPKAKPLTQAHQSYGTYLGIPTVDSIEDWLETHLIIDGLFGFGLTRDIEGTLRQWIEQINQSSIPVVSIDLPSGIHTNTGAVLGVAIAASQTFCLGLWKRAFFQEQALNWIGQAELIPFGIPLSEQTEVLGNQAPQIISTELVNKILLRKRPIAVHKYQMGAALLICGSRQYPGAAIIAAQAARASGVGMLYVAVPESLVPILVNAVPDAVIVGCPENQAGAISTLPDSFNLEKIDAIAVGPGLSIEAHTVVDQVLAMKLPLILDADALNILAQSQPIETLCNREAPTVLTPHWGEFQRLFPNIMQKEKSTGDRIKLLNTAKEKVPSTIVLKGAKTLITQREQGTLINAASTPALARGGSGDILTGLMVGLMAQTHKIFSPSDIAAATAWWHAQAALFAQSKTTESGLSPTVLNDNLIAFLAHHGQTSKKI